MDELWNVDTIVAIKQDETNNIMEKKTRQSVINKQPSDLSVT